MSCSFHLFDLGTISQTIGECSPETLIIVDAMTSVAAHDIDFDRWNIDVLVHAMSIVQFRDANASVSQSWTKPERHLPGFVEGIQSRFGFDRAFPITTTACTKGSDYSPSHSPAWIGSTVSR